MSDGWACISLCQNFSSQAHQLDFILFWWLFNNTIVFDILNSLKALSSSLWKSDNDPFIIELVYIFVAILSVFLFCLATMPCADAAPAENHSIELAQQQDHDHEGQTV